MICANDFRELSLYCTVAILAWSLISPASGAEKTLHVFQGGNDGRYPQSSLIADKAGNLYGTTMEGGSGRDCETSGCGTVFRITPDGSETILHAFAGGCDGAEPSEKLVADKVGNMYGTTDGSRDCGGTIYKITPDGTETILYTFKDNKKHILGATGGLVFDDKGNLYGAAAGGDPNGCTVGCGVVFKLSPKGKISVLYNFKGGSDGFLPEGDLIIDKAGNLYGTTFNGGDTGCSDYGCGIVFKIAPNGSETVLYSFQGGSDGDLPETGVVADKVGNLYGTTGGGGSGLSAGTVFKLTPDGKETVLHSFQGTDGDFPRARVVLDKKGNLYGTTVYGGSTGCHGKGCGVVFKVAPDGTETVLHAFDPYKEGVFPSAGLYLGKDGDLYGTTLNGGGNGNGVVFRVTD